MRLRIFENSFILWLSANDTYNWAHRPGESWPCSTLADKRLMIQFDRNGLCDLAINGGSGSQDCDSHEFNAIVSDFLAKRLPKEHPCYFVAVGQFKGESNGL